MSDCYGKMLGDQKEMKSINLLINLKKQNKKQSCTPRINNRALWWIQTLKLEMTLQICISGVSKTASEYVNCSTIVKRNAFRLAL